MVLHVRAANFSSSVSSSLRTKVISLMDEMTSKVATSPGIFRAAASAYLLSSNYRKALDFRLKAYRLFLSHPDLCMNTKLFEETAQEAHGLCDSYEEYGPLHQEARMSSGEDVELVCPDWRYQVRMTLKTLIGRTRKSFEGLGAHDSLKERLERLEQ